MQPNTAFRFRFFFPVICTHLCYIIAHHLPLTVSPWRVSYLQIISGAVPRDLLCTRTTTHSTHIRCARCATSTMTFVDMRRIKHDAHNPQHRNNGIPLEWERECQTFGGTVVHMNASILLGAEHRAGSRANLGEGEGKYTNVRNTTRRDKRQQRQHLSADALWPFAATKQKKHKTSLSRRKTKTYWIRLYTYACI